MDGSTQGGGMDGSTLGAGLNGFQSRGDAELGRIGLSSGRTLSWYIGATYGFLSEFIR